MSMFARTSLKNLVRTPIISGSSSTLNGSRAFSRSSILQEQQAPAQVGTGERNLIKEQEQRDTQAVEAEIVNDAPGKLEA